MPAENQNNENLELELEQILRGADDRQREEDPETKEDVKEEAKEPELEDKAEKEPEPEKVAEPEKEPEKPSAQEEEYNRRLQELSEREERLQALEERLAQRDKKEEEEKTPELQEFVSESEFDDAVTKPEKFNEVLNRVYQRGMEDGMRAYSQYTPQMIRNTLAVQEAVAGFFQRHPELNNPEKRQYCSYVTRQVESEHPDWDPVRLVQETERRVVESLGLEKEAERIDDKRKESKKEEPTFNPASHSRRTENKPKISDEEREIAETMGLSI